MRALILVAGAALALNASSSNEGTNAMTSDDDKEPTRPTADLGEDGELVERLRRYVSIADGKALASVPPSALRQAADRIELYREALEAARKALIETQRTVFEVYGYSKAEIDEAMDGFLSANSALRAIDAVLSRSGG